MKLTWFYPIVSKLGSCGVPDLEGMVSKMVPIKCTVCMQPLHYPLSKSSMCDTARNFDLIVIIILICLDNGLKTNEF